MICTECGEEIFGALNIIFHVWDHDVEDEVVE